MILQQLCDSLSTDVSIKLLLLLKGGARSLQFMKTVECDRKVFFMCSKGRMESDTQTITCRVRCRLNHCDVAVTMTITSGQRTDS